MESSPIGDGKPCWSGLKVRCQARRYNVSKVFTKHGEDPDRLRALTFNIFQRPFVVSHDGQYVRTCHIPRAIVNNIPDLDVLVFEEGFLGGCIPKVSMRSLLEFYGFPYNTPTVGALLHEHDYYSHTLTLTNGGVFIASRWPILDHASFVYTNFSYMTADHIARKGVMYAKILKNNRTPYHIFATHMQAQDGVGEDSTRLKQAGEISDFIQRRKVPPTEAVIIIGDLNTDRLTEPDQVELIREKLNATIPPTLGSMNATYDPRVNDVVEPGARPEWIDYAMYSQGHRQPTSAFIQGLFLESEVEMQYCSHAPLYPFFVSPLSHLCRETHSTRFMSDHFPVLAEFQF